MTNRHPVSCDKCVYCPTWETGHAMGEDFESQFYKSGECKFNEEPVLFTQGKYFVDGSRDGATELVECKNYFNAALEKEVSNRDCLITPGPLCGGKK